MELLYKFPWLIAGEAYFRQGSYSVSTVKMNSIMHKEVACSKEQFCHAFNKPISEGQFIAFRCFDSTQNSLVDLQRVKREIS